MAFRPGRFDSNLIKVNTFEKRRNNQQRTWINKESKEKRQRERQVWQALLVPGRVCRLSKAGVHSPKVEMEAIHLTELQAIRHSKYTASSSQSIFLHFFSPSSLLYREALVIFIYCELTHIWVYICQAPDVYTAWVGLSKLNRLYRVMASWKLCIWKTVIVIKINATLWDLLEARPSVLSQWQPNLDESFSFRCQYQEIQDTKTYWNNHMFSLLF